MYLDTVAPRSGRIDNACGDTGHPLVVNKKMDGFRRLWKDLGGSWALRELIFFDFDWFLLILVEFG